MGSKMKSKKILLLCISIVFCLGIITNTIADIDAYNYENEHNVKLSNEHELQSNKIDLKLMEYLISESDSKDVTMSVANVRQMDTNEVAVIITLYDNIDVNQVIDFLEQNNINVKYNFSELRKKENI